MTKTSLPAGRRGFTVVEILIYLMILAMFFLAARVGYNNFIGRKRVEVVAQKTANLFVKARSLSFSSVAKPAGCVVLDGYVVTVDASYATLSAKCSNAGVTTNIETERYTFENTVVSSKTGFYVGYKLLGHGLSVPTDFFPGNNTVIFTLPNSNLNIVLTVSSSGEVEITTQ